MLQNNKNKIVKFLKGRDGVFYSIDELYKIGVDGIVSMLPFKEKTYKKVSKIEGETGDEKRICFRVGGGSEFRFGS